jgi:hypothetical protein
MMRPKWLKDEYKFVIYQKHMDDECDIVQDYAITEQDAKKWCDANIAAYGDVEEFQFYYEEIIG